MAGIQLSGLSSGLDTDAVIAQLLAVERQPLARMQHDKTAAQTRQQALKDIESRLKNLKTAAEDLRSVTLWNPVQSVESSSDKIAARLTGGAAPGGFRLTVTQMARAAQQTYTWTPQAVDSSVTINGVTLSVAANANVDDVAAQVNGNAALGVFAVNVGGKLVLTSRATGSDAAVQNAVVASGAAISQDASDVAKAKAGLDAQYAIDGGPVQTSASNTVANAVPGVEVTLKGLVTDVDVSVSTPAVDKEAVKAKLKAFVDSYNDVLAFVTGKLTEQRETTTDGQGNEKTTAPDPKKGVLFGDSGLRDMLGSMRLTLSSPVAGMPASMSMLSQLGISTGAAQATVNADAVAGKLVLDVDKLTAALDSDPTGVQQLLGGVAGTDGFAQAFTGLLTPLVQASGVLDQRVETADDEISDLDDRMNALNDRLAARETALRKQFIAMESALAANQNQLASLLSALGNRPAA